MVVLVHCWLAGTRDVIRGAVCLSALRVLPRRRHFNHIQDREAVFETINRHRIRACFNLAPTRCHQALPALPALIPLIEQLDLVNTA